VEVEVQPGNPDLQQQETVAQAAEAKEKLQLLQIDLAELELPAKETTAEQDLTKMQVVVVVVAPDHQDKTEVTPKAVTEAKDYFHL
jgi:translation initiation factor IF-2